MVKFFKAMFFVLASAVMGGCLIAVPESSGPVSVVYMAVLGIYLGLDVAGMIAKTVALPKGEFKDLNVHKYVLSAVCLVVLVVISLIMKKTTDVSTALTSFISSVLIIFACLIGGLEGNKIATASDGTKEVENA